MTKLLDLWSRIARSPESEGSTPPPAADTPPPAAPSADSVLYPDDKPAGDPPAPEGDKPADDAAPADWKEFAPDPAKTDDENAAAKAEHDKTKPAEKSDAEKLAAIVPEDGKYALTMPEGVEVDQELLDALGPQFKAKNMTNGEAQALAEKFIEIQTARAAKQNEEWAGTINGWADQAKKDPDIGGAKWDATVAQSRRAIDTLGTPALKEYLNASGGGNHPELIRFMAGVGAMIKEDNPASGNAPGKTMDRAKILYPDD